MPLITSSRMNSAPYLSQTDFIALKYPLGGTPTPVVAPTTVSAATTRESQLLAPQTRSERLLTTDDGVRPELLELVVQLLAQPLHILLLAFLSMFKAFSVGGGDVMEVLMVENGLIGCASASMRC